MRLRGASSFPWLLGILISGAACFVLQTSALAATLPKEKEVWRRVDTPNFTVFGNVGERQLVESGRRLEQIRQILTKTTRGLSGSSPLPTYVYVFRSSASFDPYRLGKDGKPRSIAGYFAPSLEGNFVTMDASGAQTPYEVIFHEYVHYLLHNNVPAIPTWLDEGLADYYCTVKPSADGGQAQVGLAIGEYLAVLRHEGLMPMARLLAVDSSSPEYNESERKGIFYAQSWALTHWFVSDDARRARLMEYLNRLKAGQVDEGALSAALGMTPEALEKEIARYVRADSFAYYTYTFDASISKWDFEPVPIGRAETLYRLGDLLAHTAPIRYEDAEAHIHAALALEPDLTGALLTRAWLERERKRWDAAAASYEAALAKGGARARSQYASMLLERVYAERAEIDADKVPEPVLRARELYRQALALSPDDAVALAGFGSTFLFQDEDLTEGIAALARAYELMPSRVEVLVSWVALAARAGQTEAAWTTFDRRVRGRADAEQVRWAEEELARAEVIRARAARGAGHPEEASEIIARATARIRDPSVRAKLAAWSAPGKVTSASREAVDLYNAALEAAKRRAWGEARELLDRAGGATDDAAFLEAVENARREVTRIETRERVAQRYNAAVKKANALDLSGAIRDLEALLADEKTLEPEDRTRVEQTLGELRSWRKKR